MPLQTSLYETENNKRPVVDNLRQGMKPLMIDHEIEFGKLSSVLDELWQQTRQPGWDGHDALAVQADTCLLARRVIQSLPTHIPAPELSAEPDGQITLEWYRSSAHLLSISIDSNGSLHYAAMMGGRTKFGTEPFDCDFPAVLSELACEIMCR